MGAAATELIASGTQLGKYTVIHRIAFGGMAESYLARASGIQGFEKYVVLKRILPQYAANHELIRMFLQEARLAAILDHGDVEDAVVANQDASLARLLANDFGGTLLRFVDEVRATPPRSAPEVPYDFWPMFDQAERLEELRQFRPSIFRALPSSDLRPPSSAAKP